MVSEETEKTKETKILDFIWMVLSLFSVSAINGQINHGDYFLQNNWGKELRVGFLVGRMRLQPQEIHFDFVSSSVRLMGRNNPIFLFYLGFQAKTKPQFS